MEISMLVTVFDKEGKAEIKTLTHTTRGQAKKAKETIEALGLTIDKVTQEKTIEL